MKTLAMALVSLFVITFALPSARSETTTQCYDAESWCAHPPPDMGYPDSLCDLPETQQTYQFKNRYYCLATMKWARQTLNQWCSCSLDTSGSYKPGCGRIRQLEDRLSVFCVDLPPRNNAERAEPYPAVEGVRPTRRSTPCHDARSWCAHPPADMGYPDSSCAYLNNLPNQFMDTGICLDMMARARKLQEQYCNCTLEDDHSGLKPGCFFYTQPNGAESIRCIRYHPRDDAERQKLAELKLRECKQLRDMRPADWRSMPPRADGTPRGISRDELYQHCADEARSIATRP